VAGGRRARLLAALIRGTSRAVECE
jgi:hypothetical protein